SRRVHHGERRRCTRPVGHLRRRRDAAAQTVFERRARRGRRCGIGIPLKTRRVSMKTDVKNDVKKDLARTFITVLLVAAVAAPVCAELTAEELAKLAQNPVGNLISLPFQNNQHLNFGAEKGTQKILNIKPVVPISVSRE